VGQIVRSKLPKIIKRKSGAKMKKTKKKQNYSPLPYKHDRQPLKGKKKEDLFVFLVIVKGFKLVNGFQLV